MDIYRMTTTIWEDFQEQFPSMSRDVNDFYRSGRFEITVIFDDRQKAYYNYLNKTIRFIKPRIESTNDDEWKREFSIVLQKKLKEKGLTQKDLAERTGLTPVSISNYINGRSVPSSIASLNISRVLDCSVSELIDFDI